MAFFGSIQNGLHSMFNTEPIAVLYGPPPDFEKRPTGRMRQRNTLVCDLGGVLIDIDVRRCYSEFAKLIGNNNVNAVLGMNDDGEGIDKAATKRLMRDYELGNISTTEFIDTILTYCPVGTTDQQVEAAWQSMLCDIPEERLDILRMLKAKWNFRLILLSNTNELHWQNIDRRYALRSLFDEVYLSYELHLAKPSVDIFRHIDAAANVNPIRTIFVDDLSVNREVAENSVGWRTLSSLEMMTGMYF